MNEFFHIDLNESKLIEQTLSYIYSIENTYLECSLYINLLNPSEKYDNFKNNESLLKERLSKLKFIINHGEVNFKNSISGFSNHTHDSMKILREKIYDRENFSKEIFWANPNEEEQYQKISNFNCFEDKIINEKKLHQVLIKSPFFNVKEWIIYYQKLLDIKFSEFSGRIVSGKSIIKYRSFIGKYFLGIESDYQYCKDNFKKGWWEEPDYKLIIFEKLDSKQIIKILDFEKFAHPHFNPPAVSFMSFFGSKTMYDINDTETVIDNGTKKEFINENDIRLYNSEEFGNELKRHAYFYYDMLYHSTNEFIKFIQESFYLKTE